MTGIAMSSAAVLALVLVWAGSAKLRDRERTASGFRAIGVPAPGVLAIAVPLAELVTAVLLVAVPRIGGLAALVMLTAFSLFLVTRIRTGAAVGCGCFGSARERPPSLVELVRNAGLATLAVAATATPRAVVPALPDAVVVATVVAVGAVGLALLDLYVTTGRLLDNHVPPGPDGA